MRPKLGNRRLELFLLNLDTLALLDRLAHLGAELLVLGEVRGDVVLGELELVSLLRHFRVGVGFGRLKLRDLRLVRLSLGERLGLGLRHEPGGGHLRVGRIQLCARLGRIRAGGVELAPGVVSLRPQLLLPRRPLRTLALEIVAKLRVLPREVVVHRAISLGGVRGVRVRRREHGVVHGGLGRTRGDGRRRRGMVHGAELLLELVAERRRFRRGRTLGDVRGSLVLE